ADLAHTDCMRAVEVGTRLVEKYPRCTAFQYWVGVAHRADGENLISAGNTFDAMASYDQAMLRFREVLRVEPEWGHHVLRDLRGTSAARERILAISGRSDEAQVARRQTEDYAGMLAKALENSR
ncbi:MAG: hypothetical protein KDB01_28085, partial [Planctomycetaceae bacterium]|nr:hypothetical protein [Planctomycetaceae bacterium]